MSHVRERYSPVVVGANTTVNVTSNSVGGFLCVTAGTVTLTANAQDGKASYTVFSSLPVSAGVYYPFPFYLGSNGGTFTTAGGASGTLGI